MKTIFLTAILVNILVFFSLGQETLYAGFRASRVLSSYPGNKFPEPEYWVNTGKSISDKFQGSVPAGIWIVSLYIGDGITQLSWPSEGKSIEKVWFIHEDRNEKYLQAFDDAGIKVWLQVEPGGASIDTLMSLTLNRYGHHPCVIGFGVDVEWYNTHLYSGGEKLNDSIPKHWEEKLKSNNPEYSLFLKHYGKKWMPPNYRGNILFINDSQELFSLNSMKNEFNDWANTFAPNASFFQFGYTIDKKWWEQYSDPLLTIGNKLIDNIPTCKGLFWVDFTINELFPVASSVNIQNYTEFEKAKILVQLLRFYFYHFDFLYRLYFRQ